MSPAAPRVRLLGLPTDAHSSFLRGAAAGPADRFGVEAIEMRSFRPDRVPIPSAPLYISIDLDGFDPAFAPGVAHHQPGGPSVRDFLQVLQRVPGGMIGADIVELNPARDVNGVTATLAAKLVKELASLVPGARS